MLFRLFIAASVFIAILAFFLWPAPRTGPLDHLHNLGFAQARTSPEQKGIILDTEALSTIDYIETSYKDKSLTLQGLELTGEITEEGTLDIAGWQGFSGKFYNDLNAFNIKGGKLDLLHPELGGIHFDFDLQSWREKNLIQIQATAKSEQRGLTFSARLEGSIDLRTRRWQGQVQIENAGFTSPHIATTRVNGALNLVGPLHAPPLFSGDLNAGSLTLWGFALDTAAITLKENEVVIGAKALGHDTIEFSLDLKDKTLSGTIYAQDQHTILDYLSLPKTKKNPADLWINFAYEKDSKVLKYQIKDQDQTLDIENEITTEIDKKSIADLVQQKLQR